MATYFVSNAGSNTAPYDTEAKAATSLDTIEAIPWTNSDIVKISSTFAESLSTPTYTFPSTTGLKILSVLFNGSGTGSLTTGASITNATNATALSLASGFVYIYGVSFISNSGASVSNLLGIGTSTTVAIGMIFESCIFNCAGTSATARMNIGAGSTNVDNYFKFNNCTMSQGANKPITLRQGFVEINNLTLSGTVPTSVFAVSALDVSNFEIRNSDFSNLAWTNLVDVTSALMSGYFQVTNCKLISGFTTVTGTFSGPGAMTVEIIDCNSGDINYYYKRDDWYGTITASNSIYYNASDGTSSISWQMVSSSNVNYAFPLKSPPISWFNSTLSAMATTVECVNDGTTFKDNELWQETTAKITSGSPIGTINTADKADILAAGANQDASVVSWTGTGGFGSAIKQKLVSGSFTPAEIGSIATNIYLAKASSTVYVSPKILSTSPIQFMNIYGNYTNESVISTNPGIANVKTGVAYTINNLSLTGTYDPVTGQYTDPGYTNVLLSTGYTFAGVSLTGSLVSGGGTYTDPGSTNVLSGISYIFNSITTTGSLSIPVAVTGSAGTVNIGNIKENIRYVIDIANTTTGSPIDLSANMTTRVKSVMKINPEKIRVDVNLYPCVTVFASKKSIQQKTIARDQASGKRRADLTLTIVGIIWNDATTDYREDSADEDVEILMENIELILRSYASLNNIVTWQFPTDVTYHSVPYDEQAHMRVGVMDLQVTIFY